MQLQLRAMAGAQQTMQTSTPSWAALDREGVGTHLGAGLLATAHGCLAQQRLTLLPRRRHQHVGEREAQAGTRVAGLQRAQPHLQVRAGLHPSRSNVPGLPPHRMQDGMPGGWKRGHVAHLCVRIHAALQEAVS